MKIKTILSHPHHPQSKAKWQEVVDPFMLKLSLTTDQNNPLRQIMHTVTESQNICMLGSARIIRKVFSV